MRILLIDDVGVPSVLSVIRSLGLVDHKLFIFSLQSKKSITRYHYSKYVQKVFYFKDLKDIEIIQVLTDIIDSYSIDIILPVKESSYNFFANFDSKIIEQLKLPPINEPELYEIVGDKLKLHKWLKNNGLPSPESIDLVFSNSDSDLLFPCIMKPKKGAGGKGIIFIKNRMEYEDFLKKNFTVQNEYIYQEYLDLPDIDISFLSNAGEIIAYTIQKGIFRDSFSYAHGIQFLHDDGLYKTACQIVKKLKWSGIAHLDFKYDSRKGRYYLIDFNPRFWSTLLGSLSVGINFPDIVCTLASGNKLSSYSYEEKNFYLSKLAVKQLLKSILHLKKFPIRRTSLFYLLKDPLPELLSLFHLRKR